VLVRRHLSLGFRREKTPRVQLRFLPSDHTAVLLLRCFRPRSSCNSFSNNTLAVRSIPWSVIQTIASPMSSASHRALDQLWRVQSDSFGPHELVDQQAAAGHLLLTEPEDPPPIPMLTFILSLLGLVIVEIKLTKRRLPKYRCYEGGHSPGSGRGGHSAKLRPADFADKSWPGCWRTCGS
jgi:hypothetical protein